MSEISIEDVRRVAELAMLNLGESECDALRDDLTVILGYVAQIETLETRDNDPGALPAGSPLREDRVGSPDALSAEQVLRIAPVRDGNFFQVPRVIRER
jgi:aspartyl-tRNA(Asn)/glutamyl-tRNA(Gln) amidotransferase subunit C